MYLDHLTIGYAPAAQLLTDISAELCGGQFVALLGRNGAGKSTLLRTLARIIPPLSGQVRGEQPAIVVTATPDLRNTTVRQLVAYGRLPYTSFFGRLSADDLQVADQAIRRVGIQALADRLFSDLSDGERQKTMIARALAQQTSDLLLDEPSAFLDYPSRQQLFELLRTLAHEQQLAILVSTHEIELARQFADQLWVIRNDKLETGVRPEDFDPSQL